MSWSKKNEPNVQEPDLKRERRVEPPAHSLLERTRMPGGVAAPRIPMAFR